MTGPPPRASRQTLLVALAHPDDEIGAIATIAAQVARGDRVVLLWLTRGEATDAYGEIPPAEVASRREALATRVGAFLGIETRTLDFPDTGVRASRESVLRLARVLSDVRPDGVLTWGDAWARGMRHPDHQETGRIVRDAITVARIRRCVAPAEPHRDPVPVWTYRGLHSTLPAAAIDAEPWLEQILGVAGIYRDELQFPDPAWLQTRLRKAGERWGLRYAEEFDAWETPGGRFVTLLPAAPQGYEPHPERRRPATGDRLVSGSGES